MSVKALEQESLRLTWELAGGSTPEHWEFKAIESLLENSKTISVGVMYPGEDTIDGVPLIKVSDVKNGKVTKRPIFCISPEVDEVHKRTRLNGTELLITLVGEPGDCVIVKEDMKGWNAARAIAVVRLADINQRTWLRYVLLSRSAKHLIKTRLNTTVQKTLNLKDIKELGIPFPPFPEQKAIADMLSSFDEKIELLREQNKTLETLAQTIFKEWFVNFKDGKSTPISELVEFNPIERIDRKKEYLFFDMKTLSTNSMATSKGVYKKSNSGTSFREGDTLFAKITPCLENGKTAFVLDLKGETVARGSTEFIVMRAKEKGSAYLNYCICRDDNFREYAVQSMTGTSGRQRVPVDRLKTYEIQYSQGNISKFNDVAKPCFEKIKNNAAQIQNLSKTRDTLLPKLMCGEVRVSS